MSNYQGVGPVWAISVSFVYTRWLVRAFLQSHKVNLNYCLKSSLLLAFYLLFVCMVDQTQMYPSSISTLGLFQVIICNIHSVNHLIYRGLGFLKNYWMGMYPSSISTLGLFQVIICNIHSVNHLIGGWDFWKIIERGSRFSCKIGGKEGGRGGSSPYRGVVYRKGVKVRRS